VYLEAREVLFFTLGERRGEGKGMLRNSGENGLVRTSLSHRCQQQNRKQEYMTLTSLIKKLET